MISKQTFFTTTDGTPHATIQLAQQHELEEFIVKSEVADATLAGDLAKNIIEQKDAIIDILTMTAKSKPKARKINGGTKNRTPAAAAPRSTRPATDVPSE